MSLLLVVLGVVMLYLGGEFLVRNAVRLAAGFGVSSLVIGLTVVAFGTSSPELAATIVSALQGLPDVAVGNVVGSNIANVTLILGLTAITYPLQTQPRFLRRDVPIMVGICALLIPVLRGGAVNRFEGVVFLALLAGYLWFLLRVEPGALGEVEVGVIRRHGLLWRSGLGVIAGVLLLVLGARALVSGAVSLATGLGVPERVIGLTVVAFGTSLPELASSMVAAMRHETDIILGNIVGSNIFNVLAVLGATALVRPVRLEPNGIMIDLAVMLFTSVLVIPLMWRRNRLGRRGGVLLATLYLAYLVFLFS